MRLLWSYPWLLAALAVCAAGCSSAASGDAAPQPVEGVSGPDASIAFAPASTLALAPGELVTVTVATSPPDHYRIGFFLLGESLDASLSGSSVVADAEGRAAVQLRAPSSPTTFRLRASIQDGPSTEVAISVSDQGFGAIRVVPMYAGTRPVETWTAGVVAGASCAAIASTLPGEAAGAIIATAPGDADPIVGDAPVGPNLAVTLRAGHYLWGCADTSSLAPSAELAVKVTVIDKPIDLAATDLDVTLTYSPDPGPYAEMLGAATELLQEQLFPLAQPEPTVLLDEMEKGLSTPEDVAAFEAARQAGLWDTATADHLAAGVGSLRALCGAWTLAGLADQSPVIVGHLGAAEAGQAVFETKVFGGVDAAAALVPGDTLMKWTADAQANVALSGKLYWLPSRYVGAATFAGASVELPQATTVSEALATAARCDVLGELLGAVGSCDTACVAALCETALATRWQGALAASGAAGLVGELSITAGGPAQVGDAADPIAFSGEWLGQVTVGASVAGVDGEASAVDADPGPPN